MSPDPLQPPLYKVQVPRKICKKKKTGSRFLSSFCTAACACFLIELRAVLLTQTSILLTVHRSITLLDFQLDAQNSYLFTYNTCIKILYTFRALPCSSSGGLRRNCIYAASGIVTVCRCLSCAPVKKELSFLTGAQDLQRVTIPEAAYIQLRRRPPEDKHGNARNM